MKVCGGAIAPGGRGRGFGPECGVTSGAARGIDVHCGCFSTTPVESGPEPTPMLFYIGRDAMLLGLALFTAWVRLTLAREQKQNA